MENLKLVVMGPSSLMAESGVVPPESVDLF